MLHDHRGLAGEKNKYFHGVIVQGEFGGQHQGPDGILADHQRQGYNGVTGLHFWAKPIPAERSVTVRPLVGYGTRGTGANGGHGQRTTEIMVLSRGAVCTLPNAVNDLCFSSVWVGDDERSEPQCSKSFSGFQYSLVDFLRLKGLGQRLCRAHELLQYACSPSHHEQVSFCVENPSNLSGSHFGALHVALGEGLPVHSVQP